MNARRNAFRRSQRLQKPREFDRVFREGRSAGDRLLVLYAAPNGLEHRRLGIVAGRRIGGAVDRNRTKRLVREAFRTSAAEMPGGFDFVVIPNKMACKAAFDEVKSSFNELADRLIKSWQE